MSVPIQDFPTLGRLCVHIPHGTGGCSRCYWAAGRAAGSAGLSALAWEAQQQKAGAHQLTRGAYTVHQKRCPAQIWGFCGRPSPLLCLAKQRIPSVSYGLTLSALQGSRFGSVRIAKITGEEKLGVTFLFKVLAAKNVKRKQLDFQSVCTKRIPFKYFLFQ